MRRAYLFAYNDLLGDRETVKRHLNAMSTVITWRYDLPHVFYVISEATAEELRDQLRKQSGEKGAFIFTEIPDNSNGWLDSASWLFIVNKRAQPK